MADYEKSRRGGSAYMRLMEFLPGGTTVHVKTYSPAVKRYMTDPQNQFTFTLKLADRKTPKPADQLPSAQLSKAPIHRWSFNGTGATIFDSIGKAHGLLHAEDTESRLDGRGHAVLTGNGYVSLPAGLLADVKDISFEIWLTPTADRYRWNSPVRFGCADDWLTYVFRTRTVHRAEIAVRRHNEDIQRNVPVELGTPIHVVVTYDHDGADGKPLLSYYRNGKRYGQMRTSIHLSDVSDTHNVLGPFAGNFDEFRIYDYALRSEEVQGNFLAGPNKLSVVR
jgi:hypothetical protein